MYYIYRDICIYSSSYNSKVKISYLYASAEVFEYYAPDKGYPDQGITIVYYYQ